jgi:phosphatidylethanolamine-binding protein (PEBP) family uncharacterized protein
VYNISPQTTELPENAGVAGCTFGQQIFNDFFLGAEYDGSCPPNNVTSLVHDYVVTVYALDTDLYLVSSPPNFPAMQKRSIAQCSTMSFKARASTAFSRAQTKKERIRHVTITVPDSP